MALTRPRYSQIPDSDYKNSCRIVTTTDITLTSGAPQTYDGVTLVQYDRVLVTGQTDKTQNGIYSVSTLGSGSNGTWVRSKDANTNDRLTAGMNTFIEEGTYSGQFWHLLTANPIVLGVTELVFGQISGNAAGTSSQIQYNLNGTIAGAANLRYDSATGNVLIGGGTAATSNVTGALTVNGGIGVTGEIWAQSNIYSAGSRVLTAYDLQTVTFTANYISKDPANVAVPVVGTGTIYGTHNFGNLEAISTYGDYDTVAQSGYYSVNDASGAPGFIVYIGFTGITSFNRAVFNINYTQLSGHTITLDFYNYDTDAWDPFATYSGLGNWQAFTLGVIDPDPYIDAAGNVTTRVYHVSSGNTSHRTWIDYVALEQSITGGQGPRGATGATGPSGTYTGGYISGVIVTGGNIITSGNIISNSGNVSISTTTGALIITGDGGAGIGGNIFAGGNITANAFYTVNGLFWEGNGLAFSSGLEVSEIDTANTLSNISTSVTSIRFDKDTGFSVTELNPGNIKVSLGSSFKTWHVPGQSDLVAVAEDEVTFFGNGIDITTNPTFPKSITFIANNSVLEANIGSFYNYANANIGTLYLGNISTQVNLGAYQVWANGQISGLTSEISSISGFATSNAATQAAAINALTANIDAFQYYANTKIGTNNNSNLVVTSTAESVSAITGALTVAGGVGIGGNLYVAGNIFASNLVSINSTTLQVQDPLLYLNADSPYPYNYDIGFYSHFVGGPGVDHYQHTGLARDYTTNIWNFFSNIRTEPGVTIDWSNVEIVYDTVRVGDIIVANTAESTSTTTGALRVAGGAGIEGALYITNTGDVSANIGSILTNFNTLDANIGSYQNYTNETLFQLDANIVNYSTYANIYLGTATTFTITDSGSSEYVINGENNPALYLIRGQKYNFSVDASGQPFWIKTSQAIGTGDQYNTGVTNNGTAAGVVKFEVPLTAPDVLYYVSQFDAAMTNELRIVNFDTLEANIGTLYLGNISTQANLGSFQEYANTSIATLDANIGTLYLGNISTQANLGEFQTYANATFTTYSNANVAAYLPIYTGNISAGNIEVTGKTVADTFYTTNGIYWSGNGNPYSAGGGGGITYTASTTPPVSPAVGDQWYDTADGILYEYMDDGDTNQWVDIISPTFSGANPVAFNSNITVTGNIFIGDGIYWSANGDAYASGSGSFSGSDDVLRANVGAYQIYANANIGTLYLGNISTQANLGAFQTYANANIGTLFLSNASTNANLGAYQIWANSNFGTSTYSNTNVAAYRTLGATIGSGSTTANLVAAATTTSTSTTTGALVVAGGMGVAGAAYIGGATRITSGTNSSTKTTGALVVTGGIGVSGTINFNDGSTTAGLTVGGLLQTTSTTAATSSSGGAFYVAGGAGIVGNLHVDGNVILASGTGSNVVVNSTRTSTSTTTGALVVRGGAGIAGNLYTGANIVVTNGIFWAANGVSYNATPITGNVVAASGTTSTSNTTGALVVAGTGGAGIGGNLYVGGTVVLGSGTTSNVVVRATTTSSSTTTGALVVRGGLGVTGAINVGGDVSITGALTGGVGYLLERANIVSASAPSIVNIDLLNAPVMYWNGNCTANVTANIRGSSTTTINSAMTNNQTATFALFLPNDAFGYFVEAVKIDNVTVSPVWLNGNTIVSGNPNSIDVYTFTVIKTATATYKVFATLSKFQHTG